MTVFHNGYTCYCLQRFRVHWKALDGQSAVLFLSIQDTRRPEKAVLNGIFLSITSSVPAVPLESVSGRRSFSLFLAFKQTQFWCFDDQSSMSNFDNYPLSTGAPDRVEDDFAILRRIIARDYIPEYEIVSINLVFDTGAICSIINESFDDDDEEDNGEDEEDLV
jgi:hypothetical protein